MELKLSEEQVLSLAPDESSKKAGRELANPSKWVTKGSSDGAIWGECQGSGSKPYQTQIDLQNLAFKCSCPSRKFPCKHGIALGLLYARQPQIFGGTEQPAWVSEWIGKRAEKEEKKTEKKEKEPDEAAQAKRLAAREKKVDQGIDELLIWIRDIVRNGLIGLPEKDYSFWNAMAKRLIDAQAPGLAGMVKSLASVGFYNEGWQGRFMDALVDLYLIAQSYRNREGLDGVLVQELRNWIGFTVNQEALKLQPGTRDHWMVLAKQSSEEDNLTIERHWLYGLNTGQYALVLQFLIRGQGGSILLSPGLCIDAELVFFPSLVPLRALIKTYTAVSPGFPVKRCTGWKEVAELETSEAEVFPVRKERPYVMEGLVPVQYKGSWMLKDQQENMVSIPSPFEGIWKLLAISGGHFLPMAVVGKEKTFEPLGIWDQEKYKAI